ncbi:MAG: formyltransferase family protein [Ktedonobacterales bacterium]
MSPRIVFFGMMGGFSRAPLLALLDAGYDVRAVLTPTLMRAIGEDQPFRWRAPSGRSVRLHRAALPMAGVTGAEGLHTVETIADIAATRNIPHMEIGQLSDPRTLAALVALAPDAICVACFSKRLPESVLRAPRLGCLNVHPALLPDNRGPDPLFWIFQRGDEATGVTIHLMDTGLDSGPILLQEQVTVADGVTEAALEAQLAQVGGELLARAVAGLAAGSLAPTPQDEALATSYPFPTEDDFVIPPTWPARRAYRFARGVQGRGQPITLHAADGATFHLVAALGYAATSSMRAPWRLNGDNLWLRCSPGVLHARTT